MSINSAYHVLRACMSITLRQRKIHHSICFLREHAAQTRVKNGTKQRQCSVGKNVQKEDVISFDELKDAASTEHIIERPCPILKSDAFHTVLPPPSPFLSLYLSTEPVVQH